MTHNPLPPERLCRRATLDTLPFSSTDELPDLAELPGQQRALEALRFGVAVPHEGYNLFALGPASHSIATIPRAAAAHGGRTSAQRRGPVCSFSMIFSHGEDGPHGSEAARAATIQQGRAPCRSRCPACRPPGSSAG